MPEIEKKLKSLLMKVNKESENLSQNSSRKEILSRNSTFKKLSCLTYHIYLWSLRPESCDWKLRPSDGWLHLSSVRLLGSPVFPLYSLLLSSLQVLTLTSHLLMRPVLSCDSLEFPETTLEDVTAPNLWSLMADPRGGIL